MKIKSIAAAIAMMLSVLSSHAGDNKVKIKVKWGGEFKMPKKHLEMGYLGNMQDGFVLVSSHYRKTMCIQKFDTALKMISEKLEPIENLPKKYQSSGIEIVGKKNYWLYSMPGENDSKEHLYAREIDVRKGDFAGAAREIASSSDELAGYYSRWSFARSADSTKLMSYYMLAPVVRNDAKSHAVMGFNIWDENLKTIWNKEVEMPYTEKAMKAVDYQVDRNGNVYMLIKVYEDGRKEAKDDHPNYHYEVLKYSRTSDKPGVAKFELGDKYVVDIVLTEDNNGRMICAGYYAKDKNASAEGAFLYTFDEATMATKTLQKGFYEFPLEIMKQYTSEKTQKKMDKAQSKGKEPQVGSLKFRSLRVADDGSITMFGEQSYIITITYSDGKSTYTRTIYHEDNIYVMRINPDGQLKWVRKIPKNQSGNSTLGLSYFLRSDGKDSYLFFADNMKNLDLGLDEAPAMHSGGAGGVLMCVKVTDDGVVSKTNVYDFRDEGVYMYPTNFTSIAPDKIIGRGIYHKESVPMIITVD